MDRERLAQCKEMLQRNRFFSTLDVIEQLERENKVLERIILGEQMEQDILRKEIEQLKAELDRR